MQSENIFQEEKPIINIKPINPAEQQTELINIQPIEAVENLPQMERQPELPRIHLEKDKLPSEQPSEQSTEKILEKTQGSESQKEFIESLYPKLDENAEKNLPSVTEQRGSQMGLDYQRELKDQSNQEKNYPELNVAEPQVETKPKTKPKSLPTMDMERDSIVDRETRWEKEHGMEPVDQENQLRTPNPDITAESERPYQHRPSDSDEEEEKSSYSIKKKQEKPQLYEGKETEAFRPTEKESTITHLQKSEEDRNKPTTVQPSSELNISTEQTQPRPPLPDEKSQEQSQEFKEKFGKLKIDIKERHDEQAKQSVLGTQSSVSSPETPIEKIETHEYTIHKEDKFDLQEIIDYLNEHKNVIEQTLSESDKKKIQVILHVAKDFKALCEEALETFKEDLLGFYSLAKQKFAHALSDIKTVSVKTRE